MFLKFCFKIKPGFILADIVFLTRAMTQWSLTSLRNTLTARRCVGKYEVNKRRLIKSFGIESCRKIDKLGEVKKVGNAFQENRNRS